MQRQTFNKLIESIKSEENKMQQIQELAPTELLEFAVKYEKLVKIDENIQKIGDQQFTLFDIKIGVRDNFEDELFAQSLQIHQNIRRGLSLAKSGDQIFVARKGLKKFFDIDLDLLASNGKRGSDIDQQLYEYTLSPVYNCLKEKHKVKIYMQEKANGKNAQISYLQQLNGWVIGSKNVTIFCQDQNQIQAYKGQNKYKTAVQVAEEWFKLVENHPNIEIIKQYLSGKTLVGELCGDPNDQHLVKYDKLEIRFFAIVGNNSEYTCLNPVEARQFIQNQGFHIVKSKEFEAPDRQSFREMLDDLHRQVSNMSIEEEGEGVVLYFCNADSGECLCLGKLKTVQYRLERKLREKLRLCLADQGTAVSLFGKFKSESEALCRELQVKLDLSNYIEFSKAAFTLCWNFTRTKPKQDLQKLANILVQQQYLVFVEIVKQNLNNTKSDVITEWLLKNKNQMQDEQNEL